jgi:hypothetical protein
MAKYQPKGIPARMADLGNPGISTIFSTGVENFGRKPQLVAVTSCADSRAADAECNTREGRPNQQWQPFLAQSELTA